MTRRDYIPGNLLLIPCALTLAACATLQPAVEAPPPPFVVLDVMPASRPLTGTSLFQPSGHSVTFEVVDGDNAGEAIKITRAPTGDYGAAWADVEDDVRTEYFRVAENGDVLLTAVVERSDRAITLFDPPLTAVYAALHPGAPIVQEVAMRVMDLNHPKREREAGTATQTITHLGKRRVQTAKGEFVADCVSVKFEARLRMARAVRESTLYVVEGIGLVAAIHQEKITALGLFQRRSQQTLVRRDLASLMDAAYKNGR